MANGACPGITFADRTPSISENVSTARSNSQMKQPIVGYHQDEEGHWVAELRCGHGQHVRHDPPLQTRAWVMTDEGRASRLGVELDCLHCELPG